MEDLSFKKRLVIALLTGTMMFMCSGISGTMEKENTTNDYSVEDTNAGLTR